MPRILNRIYDRFISGIKDVREKFGIAREPLREPERVGLPQVPEIGEREFVLGEGLEERITFDTWSSIAQLDLTVNRFRDAQTGLFLSGEEYRDKRSSWRTGFLDQLLHMRFPSLLEDERLIVVRAIEDVRNSELDEREKDIVIRNLVGS